MMFIPQNLQLEHFLIANLFFTQSRLKLFLQNGLFGKIMYRFDFMFHFSWILFHFVGQKQISSTSCFGKVSLIITTNFRDL